MSRSVKRTPISGRTTAQSEKYDKQLANRRLRRAVRQALHRAESVDVVPHRRALTDPWTMAKDGKMWFDAARFPELLRK